MIFGRSKTDKEKYTYHKFLFGTDLYLFLYFDNYTFAAFYKFME